GFFSLAERNLFLDLMKVDGIGPKQGLKILSSIPFMELELALDAEDISRLESAPGIGKKTAQKMILTLKGKLTRIDDSSVRNKNNTFSQFDDIINALCGMGFDRRSASETVEKLARELKYAPGVSANESDRIKEQELFRRSIVALSS
ncbi:MAG TPA: Holliday junction branch migration protein RuvA, partial [Treponemataceae bacterium]|nr:Holliday junction branch migration protein RuvA [Treponemataceae bacterium]